MLQGRYNVKVTRLNKVQGLPFSTGEVLSKIEELAEN